MPAQNDCLETIQSWEPTASLQALKARAELLEDIRSFFKERNVLEVETPLMCAYGVTDLHLHTMSLQYSSGPNQTYKNYYLQTSPEFAMKRLLAAGLGSIYQICKAFRNFEQGRLHNPEFTMLEWYQLNYDHHALMDEMEVFLIKILGIETAKRFSYHELFLTYLNIEPHHCSREVLRQQVEKHGVHMEIDDQESLSKDDWLNILMTHCIEPRLTGNQAFFVYDYPESQAALAKIRTNEDGTNVAERFEVYVNGLELANGYHELSDPGLQLQRFQQDNHLRKYQGLPTMVPDMRLVSALQSGFPACAGVALGVDRLLMLKLQCRSIEEVVSFTIDRA